MRSSAFLLIGTAAVALATPAYGQTEPEEVAQAANPPEAAQTSGDEIIVTATKRATTVALTPAIVSPLACAARSAIERMPSACAFRRVIASA